MVKPKKYLLKMLFRSIKINYKQFISIIGISFLAICLYTGTIANSHVIKDRVDLLYEQSNMADVFLYYNEIEQDDHNLLDTIKDIDAYEERLLVTGQLNELNINIIVKTNPTISKPYITKGESGFLVSEVLCRQIEKEIGDTVYFNVTNIFKDEFNNIDLSNMLLDGQDNVLVQDTIAVPFVITGYMQHSEGVQNSEFSTSLGYMEEDYLKEHLINYLALYYNEYVIDYVEANYDEYFINNQMVLKTSNPDKVVEIIDEYYKLSDNLMLSVKLSSLQSNVEVQADVEQAKNLTLIFPSIFFFVSVLVIATTLGQMIFKERTLIGTMKAMGLTKGEIITHYASYGVFLCLIGVVLGTILGPIIITWVMNIKYNLLWELPASSPAFFYFEYIYAIIILLFIAITVSYLCVRKEVDLLPAESMRPVQHKNIKYSKFKGSISLKMAIRNIKANLVKAGMVVVGVMGCTGLLVCAFGILDTLDYCVQVDFTEILKPDINLTYNPALLGSHKEELLKIEGIKKIEEVNTYPIKIKTDHIEDSIINLIDDDSLLNTDYHGSGVTLNQALADSLNVKVGDTITIIIDGKQYERVVEQIFTAAYLKGVFDEKVNFEGLGIPPTQVWIELEDGADPYKVKEELSKLDYISEVLTLEENFEYVNSLLSNVKMMTDVVKVFAIALAIIVIYNLASLNINERIRDIATMKVLGFNKLEIAKSLMYESLILATLGALIGLFIGYPLVVAVMMANRTNLVTFLYHVDLETYIISFLISIVTAVVVDLILVNRANKIQMIESLKSVE